MGYSQLSSIIVGVCMLGLELRFGIRVRVRVRVKVRVLVSLDITS